MKFRFSLYDAETNETYYYGTLKEIEKKLNLPYHQIRSIYSSDKKVYLHPNIKELTARYKIVSVK
jgi:hypothetical protein